MVIIIVLVIMGYFFVKNITQGFRDTEETLKSLSANNKSFKRDQALQSAHAEDAEEPEKGRAV